MSVLHEHPVGREPVKQAFLKALGLNGNRASVTKILEQTLDCIRGYGNPYPDE